jgi:hypothetical protein
MEMPNPGPNYVNQDPDLAPPVKLQLPDWEKINSIRHMAGSEAVGFLIAFLACDLIPPVHLAAAQRIVKKWEDAVK